MADKFFADLLTIASAIVGLTIIAVLVSKKANTANVIASASTGFGSVLKAAVSPVA